MEKIRDRFQVRGESEKEGGRRREINFQELAGAVLTRNELEIPPGSNKIRI